MSKKTKIIIIISLIVLFSLGAGVGYYFALKTRNAGDKELNNNAKPTVSVKEDEKSGNKDGKEDSEIEQTGSKEEKQYKSSILLNSFFADYKATDPQKMLSYFTDPVTESEKNQKSLFLEGKDVNGNLGGPQLFQTSIASGVTESYEILKEEEVDGKIKVGIKEKRTKYNMKTAAQDSSYRDAFLELVTVKTGELKIDKYYTDECNDKYCGFLL
ncbi:TPA: hypothetical protein DDW69_03305 [candidate division CPR2 bacterium]|uniref:Uncharacterized protein n=1 Tax=candidate division CPR2 bacterium GW2011_GWC1_41_48 TaxID=1618344 RepID=A0A0G0Z7S8_UNCC2|nr:MAG: hypothetical protein UT47_C0003G0144 [candidate division CPR2 bacterium GW2011_GWC2_39_35]KKR28367.1 MAG: hypothetical protein UT60_C0022G0023 [candidate division CPR2 bacterium GW2011_GWD2_39_7]KKR29129.1 MAG: hypothetical protein UT59_C0012G0006 [candidate division CPR2 bacterium GW2011_GWD1_39_7]KKS09083.1 MAG: hypothetical protein UU65_C0003G0138 [candidate division CPR2 bacterium GW2011_GWC1_41_48]OGB62144.1 MAG: hypothetical protein A2Y27_00595 [candidate division CPR2 bacterium G